MPELSLFLLGIPCLEQVGRAVAVERHKSLALLAYLAVTGAAHRRDALAALLWPELDQTRARAALRRTLSALNVALAGPWLEADRETIGLASGSGLWLDVNQFHGLLAGCRGHGHPEAEVCPDCLPPLAEAARLCRGDFLAGFSLRDAPGFDDWQFFQTESLRQELASALDRLARGHGLRREFEPAIGFARRWVALDPLHEPAHCQLMRLYAWAGQRALALHQYAECARLLEAELGVSPQAATADLQRAIRENRPPPLPEAPALRRPGEATALPEYRRPPTAPLAAPYSMLDRIVRGRLVGRERELTEAAALWHRAASGEGLALFLSGEPGIGKTRLARELAELAQAAGGRVLVGGCRAEGGPPYAPLAEILRETLAAGPARPVLPDYVLADLLALAPHLRPRFPDVAPNPILDPQFEQQRIFDSFAAWARALAAGAPLLLLVEDVHWADAGTLSLLRHLARHAGRLRLLLVMTYRDAEAELDRDHPLNLTLLDLNRERLAEHVGLGRLSREHTGDLLRAILATEGEITPEFVDGLYRETEGNPFFVEEVCKGLIEQGKLYHSGGTWRRADMQTIFIPATVRGAILSRVERLPAPAQEALRLAAILGREFDLETLRQASDQAEDALAAGLGRAERAQLIGEAPHVGRLAYAFAHALIPFALRESLGALRRQRLHRRAATVLESLRPNDVEALAYHFAAAGERGKALEYARRAAERAEALYAYDAAIQHLQTALALAEADEQSEMRLALLEQLADLYRLHGARTEAMLNYQAALEVWRNRSGADKWIAVRLHRKVGETFLRLHPRAEMQAFEAVAKTSLESGLQLTRGEPPHLETVRLLTTLANAAYWRAYLRDSLGSITERATSKAAKDALWQSYLGDPDLPNPARAEPYARAAIEMAEQLDAPVELSAALDALATDYSARGLFRECVELARRRLVLSRDPRFRNQREAINVLSKAGAALTLVGEYQEALPHLAEAETLASQIRDVSQQVGTLGTQAQCFLGLDRWDEMLAIEDKRLALEEEYGRDRIDRMCFYCGLSANVLALRGEAERGRARREEAYHNMTANWGPSDQWPGPGHY